MNKESSPRQDAVQQASEYFGNGQYCSQAVCGAFCEKYGLDRETAFKLSCGLNSGARSADICGAVLGAILVIGLKHGDTKEKCNQETEEFLRRFQEKYGDIICRNLLGCDISTPDGAAKAVEANLFPTRCMDLVIGAAQILHDSGY